MATPWFAVALITSATPEAPTNPCEPAIGRHGYTLLLQESGQFVHCRGGEPTETGPFSHEMVSLQLPPEGPQHPYRFRMVDSNVTPGHHHQRLLKDQIEIIGGFEKSLHDLSTAPASVGEMLGQLEPAAEPPPLPAAAPSGPKKDARSSGSGAAPLAASHTVLGAEAAQAAYLGITTPAFIDAAHQLRRNWSQFEGAAARVDDLCRIAPEHTQPGSLHDNVARLCSANPGATAMASLKPLSVDLAAFVESREAARTAVLEWHMTPTSASEQDTAAKAANAALKLATAAAWNLVLDSHEAAMATGRLARDVDYLRAALDIPLSPAGKRIHLGRFPANGLFSAPEIYQVHIAREPSPLFEVAGSDDGEAPAAQEEKKILMDQFQPAYRPYFNLGVSLMYSAGLPPHPELSGRVGAQTLVKVPTEGFSGGILASLEPLEFTGIPGPWASVLRFPTIIVPFTLNPLENYFVGGGVGFEEVGSIDIGTHLALTRIPSPDSPYGTQFTTSPIRLDHLTQSGPLAGGFFVSVSLDVIGIIHLIVDEARPATVSVGRPAVAQR